MNKKDLNVTIDHNEELDAMLGKSVPRAPVNKKVRWFGLLIVVLFFGGFALWSTLAPIESAAIANGTVKVFGSRRTIQHLEGGIVKKINVRDGEVVKKGDILVRLEDTKAKAALSVTQGETYQLLAIEGRLLAERDHQSEIEFDQRLVDASKDDQKLIKVMKAQQEILDANEGSFVGNTTILTQQISQIEDQIKGVKAQHESNMKQHAFIEQEVDAVKKLADKKLIEVPKLLELQRAAAKLQGAQGENQARISMLKQKIGETKTKINTMKFDRRKEILTSLRDTQQKLSDLLKKEVVEKDVYERTLVRSPQNGSVVSLDIHTVGGVIKPGQPLMDIVPEEKLDIQAHVNPIDIDVVKKGLTAKVQLVAFSSRNTPALNGTVTSVSADAYTDEKTGQMYYKADIQLNKNELARLKGSQELYPGMPVQVMIITDNRTLFNYLMAPVKDSFNRAFREQ